MREILFRGKQIDNGEWVEGYYAAEPYTKNTYNYGYILENEKDLFAKKSWLVDSRTVGQFTGLTDKNGRKIFEGDILQGFWYCEGVRAKVVWIDDAATFGILYSFRKSGEKTAWLNSSWYKFTSESPCFPEIIGNIYDNPELLEVTE